MIQPALRQPIRVVAIMEAHTVTGPAKNLIRFAQKARVPDSELPPVELSIATFYRPVARQTAAHPSNQFIDAARAAGIEVDVIAETFQFDPRVISQLAAVLRRRNPDIIQTHGIKGHFLLWMSRLHMDRRWLAFHHGYTAENLKMHFYNTLNRVSLPAANRVITVCNPFAEMLANRGVDKSNIEVLPNSIENSAPVSAEEVGNLRKQLEIRPDERVLVTIGRFSTEKGHSDLISAMARLTQMLPDVSIRHVLVGDGLERHNVEHAAAAAGIRSRFIFAGYHQDVRPFYALADIYVLSSHSEGSPNVLLEAMTAGVPIVATAVGGVPETVRHEETALLVEPHHPEQLAEAVARLLNDDSLRRVFAGAASRDVANRFSPDAYRRNLISIYQRELALR
jgi:glycosyltransferase involved in cell wall biosynthesis